MLANPTSYSQLENLGRQVQDMQAIDSNSALLKLVHYSHQLYDHVSCSLLGLGPNRRCVDKYVYPQVALPECPQLTNLGLWSALAVCTLKHIISD